MGNALLNITDIQQNFMNTISQKNQQTCSATAITNADNNVIIVSGSKIKGDFIGVQNKISTDATCLITSNMGNTIDNILEAISQQTNKANTDAFNDFTFNAGINVNKVKQNIINNISQINEATCYASTIQTDSNNYIYVSNSSIGGNFIGVNAAAQANASCAMSNYMKNATYNYAQASSKQTNKVIGMFAGIAGVLILLIGMIIVLIIVVVTFGALRGKRKEKIKVQSNVPVTVAQ